MKIFRGLILIFALAYLATSETRAACPNWLRALRHPTLADFREEDWKAQYEKAKLSTKFEQGALSLVHLMLLHQTELELNSSDVLLLRNTRDLLEQSYKIQDPDYGQNLAMSMAADFVWSLGPFLFREPWHGKRKRIQAISHINDLLSGDKLETTAKILGIEVDGFLSEVRAQSFGEQRHLNAAVRFQKISNVLRPALFAFFLSHFAMHPVDQALLSAKERSYQNEKAAQMQIYLADYLAEVESRTKIFSQSDGPAGQGSVSLFVDKDLIPAVIGKNQLTKPFVDMDPITGPSELALLVSQHTNIFAKGFSEATDLAELLRTNSGSRATIIMIHGDPGENGKMVYGGSGTRLDPEVFPQGAMTNDGVLMIISCNGGLKGTRNLADGQEDWVRLADRLGTNRNLQVFAPVSLVGFTTHFRTNLTDLEKSLAEVMREAEVNERVERLALIEQILSMQAEIQRRYHFVFVAFSTYHKGLGLQLYDLATTEWKNLNQPEIPPNPGIRHYDQATGKIEFIPIFEKPIIVLP